MCVTRSLVEIQQGYIRQRYLVHMAVTFSKKKSCSSRVVFSSRNIVLPRPPYVLFMHVSLNFPSLLAVLLQHKPEVLVCTPLNSLNLSALKN